MSRKHAREVMDIEMIKNRFPAFIEIDRIPGKLNHLAFRWCKVGAENL